MSSSIRAVESVGVQEIYDPLTGELHSAEDVDVLFSVFGELESFSRQVEEAKTRIRELVCRTVGQRDPETNKKPRATSAPSPCTASQKLELRRLRNALAIGQRQWRELLELHGVATAHDLSYVQANDLLRLLGCRLRAVNRFRPHEELSTDPRFVERIAV